MILQEKNIHMVKVFDNIIPDKLCQDLIRVFESNKSEQEYINEDYCPCFTQVNVNQISTSVVKVLVPFVKKVYDLF